MKDPFGTVTSTTVSDASSESSSRPLYAPLSLPYSPAPDARAFSDRPPPPPYTAEANQALQDLHTQIQELNHLTQQRPRKRHKSQVMSKQTQVYNTMVRISQIHPDQFVRSDYAYKAEEFRKGDEEAKGNAIKDIMMSVKMLILGPLVLTGAVFLLVGGIVATTGNVCSSIGHCLSRGLLRKYKWVPGGKVRCLPTFLPRSFLLIVLHT